MMFFTFGNGVSSFCTLCDWIRLVSEDGRATHCRVGLQRVLRLLTQCFHRAGRRVAEPNVHRHRRTIHADGADRVAERRAGVRIGHFAEPPPHQAFVYLCHANAVGGELLIMPARPRHLLMQVSRSPAWRIAA